MIADKFYLTINENLAPVCVSFDEDKEDYVFESIPQGITLYEMNDLIEEVNRVTMWEG